MTPDPKRITPRDEKYKQYVREQPCAVCDRTPCEPCHSFGRRGERIKSSDYSCIPLCTMHHKEQHKGFRTFERENNLNYFEIAFRLFHEYKTGVPV